jgi:hypothetical protein
MWFVSSSQAAASAATAVNTIPEIQLPDFTGGAGVEGVEEELIGGATVPPEMTASFYPWSLCCFLFPCRGQSWTVISQSGRFSLH